MNAGSWVFFFLPLHDVVSPVTLAGGSSNGSRPAHVPHPADLSPPAVHLVRKIFLIANFVQNHRARISVPVWCSA